MCKINCERHMSKYVLNDKAILHMDELIQDFPFIYSNGCVYLCWMFETLKKKNWIKNN